MSRAPGPKSVHCRRAYIKSNFHFTKRARELTLRHTMFIVRCKHDVTLRSFTITALLFPPPSWDVFFLSFRDRLAFRGLVDEEIERQRHNRTIVEESGFLALPSYESRVGGLHPLLKCKIVHDDNDNPPDYDDDVKVETPPPTYESHDCMWISYVSYSTTCSLMLDSVRSD